jgi:N-acetylmuramoyl-L-alanine amidase
VLARVCESSATGAAEGLGRMSARRKIFHQGFAPASPVFTLGVIAILGCSFLALISTGRAEGSGKSNVSNAKRQAAADQFARAEDQREALNLKAPAKRTLADYKQVVATYRRVGLITPHAPEVSESLMALGELYTEMGDRFGRAYSQSAVDSYRFLLHDYPGSKYAQEAMFRMGQLEKDQLGDTAAATKTFDEFLRKYPRSAHRREAQETRAELAVLQNHDEAAPARADSRSSAKSALRADELEGSVGGSREPVGRGRSESAIGRAPASESGRYDTRDGRQGDSAARATTSDEDAPAPAASRLRGDAARVQDVSAAVTAEYTRVTIQLEDRVEYSSARLQNPERIFFDLHLAKLTPEAARKAVHVEGPLLSSVRVGQYHPGIVRVVLAVSGVKDYVASLAGTPPRLVIDLYPGVAPKAAKVAASDKEEAAQAQADEQVRAAQVAAEPVVEKAIVEKTPRGADDGAGGASGYGNRAQPLGVASGPSSKIASTVRGPAVSDAGTATMANSLPSPVATLPSAKARSKGKGAKPDLIQPSTTAQPLRDGQSTLTRALGLKIGRIVIDAGHGGHDTGTIGPTGLMEKDLCLDVALRLGKIIQQRLPGADVVFTRSDDTFIPLEERTHIANEAKADLFVSIHANSSRDHQARGIETYYLNLKGSAEAMEVAARENATANESVHDLEDLVKRIARSEKIDESREFASDIQESLAKRIQKNYKPVKDRGVRKAPFVVLIGADMPSILTEISFLSNPADEQLLKKPEHRQRVAEGLYQGVASYLQNLNSMTVNVPKMRLKPASRSMASASVETLQNPQ